LLHFQFARPAVRTRLKMKVLCEPDKGDRSPNSEGAHCEISPYPIFLRFRQARCHLRGLIGSVLGVCEIVHASAGYEQGDDCADDD
jgi:hypothetical protein